MSDVEEGPAVEPVRGILFAHGRMAAGMVDALRTITGVDEGVVIAVSNEGKGPEALREIVDELAGASPALVFTDLPSGSCATAARLSCRGQGDRVVISGVNLPMLLDFAFNRTLPVGELATRLVEKSRDAVLCFPERAGKEEP